MLSCKGTTLVEFNFELAINSTSEDPDLNLGL